MVGLLLIVQIPELLAPLLYTTNSQTVAALFNRYMDTVLHMLTWYSDNPFDQNSKSYKSFKEVNKYHEGVGKTMNGKESRREGEERVYISQYDMAITQWSSVCFIVLYPEKCGLYIPHKELEDIVYAWRVFGYLLGLYIHGNAIAKSLILYINLIVIKLILFLKVLKIASTSAVMNSKKHMLFRQCC